MEAKVLNILLFILTTVFAAVLGAYLGLKNNYTALKQSYDEVLNELETLTESYNQLSFQYEELQENYTTLKNSYEILEKDYRTLKKEHAILKRDYNDLKEELEEINDSYIEVKRYIYDWITEGIQYFEDEGYPGTPECYDGNLVDIPCIIFGEHYTYRTDYQYNGGYYLEKLKTPRKFAIDKGGDCEDFAFYFYCLLNSSIRHGYGVRLMQHKEGAKYPLFGLWYYKDALPVEVKNPTEVGFYCSVACSDEENISHCVDYVCNTNGECIWFEPETGSIREPCRNDSDKLAIEIKAGELYLGNRKI